MDSSQEGSQNTCSISIHSDDDQASGIELSKTDINRLISQGSIRISFTKKEGKSSDFWKSLEVVNVDEKTVDFVRCTECSILLAYKTATGTSALSRHYQSKCGAAKIPEKPRESQRKISDYSLKIVPKDAQEKLNKSIVIALAKDLRPLSAVEGKGFTQLMQILINFGANYGCQDANKVIRHRTTLKREYLPKIVWSKELEIKALLNGAPQNPNFALTTDMWSDKYKQRSFLSLTIHYINGSWALVNHMLAVEEFTEQKKTTDNIRKQCQQILSKYFDNTDVETVIHRSVLVTDGGSNMINLFDNREACQCHKLNLFVHWALNNNPAPDSEKVKEREQKGNPYPPKKLFVLKEKCPKFQGALSGVKDLVTYFKRSNLNSKLTNTLKQDVTTRWNSELIMLKSYDKASAEIKKILYDNNMLHKLQKIDDGAVKDLINFLSPFMECSEVLSMEKSPTIHLVAPWFYKLEGHLENHSSDSDDLKTLKTQGRICFEEYCTVSMRQYLATFLNPRYRKLKFVNADRRESVYKAMKNLLRDEIQRSSTGINSSLEAPAINTDPPIAKRSKFADLEDSDDEDIVVDNNCRAEMELQAYMTTKFAIDDNFDILEFWCGATTFPHMQIIAQQLLAIPASQASDERVFSSTGQTISPRRTQLNASTLASLTFVHKNF